MATRPELLIVDSSKSIIRSNSPENAVNIPPKCPNCKFIGGYCLGMGPKAGFANLKPNITKEEIKEIISDATCKPRIFPPYHFKGPSSYL